jgi:4-hydroxy-4-methyl-2-oxoglutarate aldolase
VSDAALHAFFAGAGAASVHEAYGRRGDLDPAIRAIVPGLAVAGPAFCAICERGDNLALHRAVAEASAGEIIVVSGHGEACGYLGDILAEAAICRGIAGIVVDGSVRDASELRKMRFPVWAGGLAIRGATKTHPGLIGTVIQCGGVQIAPGDLIVADDDGVCAVPRANVAAVMDATKDRLAREIAIRDRLRQGALTLDLLDLRKYLHPK